MEEIFRLASDSLAIKVRAKGAELCSLQHTHSGIEYIWQGESWPKHSPILFPIVGGLKKGRYQHEGKTFELPRHGFARERMFKLIEQTNSNLIFSLSYDESSLWIFPFKFELRVIYSL